MRFHRAWLFAILAIVMTAAIACDDRQDAPDVIEDDTSEVASPIDANEIQPTPPAGGDRLTALAGGGEQSDATPTVPTPAADVVLTIATLEDEAEFDRDTLEAPPDTDITVEFVNNSPAVHNIHFYSGDSDDSDTLAASERTAGPGTLQVLTFHTPAEPGKYYFRCDVHADVMEGQLIVGEG